MAYPVHYVPAGDVLPIFFSTYGKTDGESITMTDLAITDIEIYKDGSATQRASDAGYALLDTDGTDFDGITGVHGFSIDTGDNTDAGFYTVGAWFHVVVSAVTVDTEAVNFVAAAFRLMPAESSAGAPKVDVSHAAGTAWASGAITSGVFASGAVNAGALATDAVAEIADGVWDEALAGHLGAGSTGEALDNAGSGGAGTGTGLTDIPWNSDWDAEVQSEVADALAVMFSAARTEPAQGAPSGSATALEKLDFVYKLARNKITQDATTLRVFADNGTTVDHKAPVSDDGSTYTRGEIVSGP